MNKVQVHHADGHLSLDSQCATEEGEQVSSNANLWFLFPMQRDEQFD